MSSFTIKLLTFLCLLIADIFFYIDVWPMDFAKRNQDIYLIVSMMNDPIFIGGIIAGFLAFKKSHFKTAFFFMGLPLLLTLSYYWIFR